MTRLNNVIAQQVYMKLCITKMSRVCILTVVIAFSAKPAISKTHGKILDGHRLKAVAGRNMK
jgi:hypothetical protein